MNVRIITTRHAEAEWSSVVVGTADPDTVLARGFCGETAEHAVDAAWGWADEAGHVVVEA
jgi:hypothetical protein